MKSKQINILKRTGLSFLVLLFIYILGFFIIFPITIKVQAVPYVGKLSGLVYHHYHKQYVQEFADDNNIKVLWNKNAIFWCGLIDSCKVVQLDEDKE